MSTAIPNIMGTKEDVIFSDLKGDNPLMPTQTTQEGHILPVSPADSRRVLRKIDMWLVTMEK